MLIVNLTRSTDNLKVMMAFNCIAVKLFRPVLRKNNHEVLLNRNNSLDLDLCFNWKMMSRSTFQTKSNEEHRTKILYDGDCKICEVEISILKRYTKNKDNLLFVDISSLDYDPSHYGGVSYEDAMKEMHVIGYDGRVYIQGDAIRQMYKACGLGWLASFTELPVIKPMCDSLYKVFAKYRLRKAFERCDSSACSIKLKHLRDKVEGNR